MSCINESDIYENNFVFNIKYKSAKAHVEPEDIHVLLIV